jgi:predicted  nucleic acid-binding Zn-ribbon protein
MHKCVRCGRAATSLQEINNGCPCGSKVFVFNREAVAQVGIAGEPEGIKNDESSLQVEVSQEKSGGNPEKVSGNAPESYFARMAFTDEDVENIKVVTEGVFSIDLLALSKNPVVLKDEEGVYYVRIPFEHGEEKSKKSNGKKK